MGPRGFEELLATLLTDFDRSAGWLDAALKHGDLVDLARVSHMVISLAATLAAHGLSEQARATETAANASDPEAASLGAALLSGVRAMAEELRDARSRHPA